MSFWRGHQDPKGRICACVSSTLQIYLKHIPFSLRQGQAIVSHNLNSSQEGPSPPQPFVIIVWKERRTFISTSNFQELVFVLLSFEWEQGQKEFSELPTLSSSYSCAAVGVVGQNSSCAHKPADLAVRHYGGCMNPHNVIHSSKTTNSLVDAATILRPYLREAHDGGFGNFSWMSLLKWVFHQGVLEENFGRKLQSRGHQEGADYLDEDVVEGRVLFGGREFGSDWIPLKTCF